MTTELTKAAQQALEALLEYEHAMTDKAEHLGKQAISALQSALAQRPAAQEVDERAAFEAEMRDEEVWGHRPLKKDASGKYNNWCVDLMWHVWQARSLRDAPQQATPDHAAEVARLKAVIDELERREIRSVAQQATPAQEVDGVPEHLVPRIIRGAVDHAAQRPAAQEVDEREAQELAHNIMLWREDARMHGSEYVPVHVHTLDKLIEQLRGLPAPQQATPDHFPGVGQMLRATPARPDFEAWWSSDGPNTVSPYDAARSGWDAAIAQQATPEPVGAREALERIASWNEHPTMLGVDYGSNGVRDYYRKIARDALTRPAAAPAVPEDSALLDYLDTLAARTAGSDLHCFGGRVVLYVRTGIGSQVEASGAGTAREAIRAAMLAAAQAKGGA